jgi:mono/diheme cytochrome c family protein
MRLLAFIGALAILAATAVAAYFFGGYYDVAATASEPSWVSSAIARVRQASIARHATGTPAVSMSDPAAIQAGARAFAARGCVTCHGGPGAEWAKFSEGLRPDPPDLKELGPQTPPEQLFWVIRNGIRMTGMPSFATAGAGDMEIWTIAAFVKNLDKVSEADFKAWTASTAGAAPAPGKSPGG